MFLSSCSPRSVKPIFSLPSASSFARTRNADAARLGHSFEPRRDVDAFPEEVGARENDVADIDPYPGIDPFFRRHLGIALGHGPLDFDGTAQRIHDAREFDQNAVARGFDDPTMMLRDFRVDELLTDRPQPSQRPLFVGSHETAVSRDIGRENGGEPALHARAGLALG